MSLTALSTLTLASFLSSSEEDEKVEEKDDNKNMNDADYDEYKDDDEYENATDVDTDECKGKDEKDIVDSGGNASARRGWLRRRGSLRHGIQNLRELYHGRGRLRTSLAPRPLGASEKTAASQGHSRTMIEEELEEGQFHDTPLTVEHGIAVLEESVESGVPDIVQV